MRVITITLVNRSRDLYGLHLPVIPPAPSMMNVTLVMFPLSTMISYSGFRTYLVGLCVGSLCVSFGFQPCFPTSSVIGEMCHPYCYGTPTTLLSVSSNNCVPLCELDKSVPCTTIMTPGSYVPKYNQIKFPTILPIEITCAVRLS